MSVPPPLPGSTWLVAACRFALGTGPEPMPATDVDDAAIIGLAMRHRVVGLLGPERTHLGLSDTACRLLGVLWTRIDYAGLDVAGALAVATAGLERAGLRSLAVKGPALSVILGDGPQRRGGTDLDIWVRRTDLATAVDALGALGWTPAYPERSPLVDTPAWRRRLCDAFEPEMVLSHPERAAIDLHWRLMRSNAALPIDFDEAWERSVVADAITPTTRTLGPADALRHLAAHHSKDAWPLMRHVVDIVRVARLVDDLELASIAAADHNVALALAIAAHLDPAYSSYRDRHPHLADRAWAECLSTRLQLGTMQAATGREAVMLRAAAVGWQARATRPWRAALHPLVEWALPIGALRDPRPLVSALSRDLVGRRRSD